MKTRLFIILVFSHFVSFGQTSHSLVDTNKVWSNLFRTSMGAPPPYIYETHFVKFKGDTIIDFKSYKKVYYTNDSAQFTWSSHGYIREDANKRVYFYSKQDINERLLYDFSVQTGDTLHIFNSGLAVELLVQSVDSVFIYDKYVKRINLFPGETWYEGIGSSCGVFGNGLGGIVGAHNDLLCYHENDTLKYMNPAFNDCYISISSVDDYKRDQIRAIVFPNPVVSTSILKVESVKDKRVILQIYSLLGQRLVSTEIIGQTTINKSDFDSGIYIYRIIAGSFVYTGKFQIE